MSAPKLLTRIQPTQLTDIHPDALDRWTEGVLEGDIGAIPYNERGLEDEEEVLYNTDFYVGYVDERVCVFAGLKLSTPSEDDYRYDPDDGWVKVD